MPHPGARQQAFIPVNQSLTESCRTAGEWGVVYPPRHPSARWLPLVIARSLSHVRLFVTPRTAACLAPLTSTISEFAHIYVGCVSDAINHLILCCSLLLVPSVFPSIRVFSNESAFHIRWPKYGSFSFSFGPSNGYSGLISFRTDWFNLLAFQETFKSLLLHHNLKASILQLSVFFVIQLWHPYMTTGKNIALTKWIFVGKVISLLFNVLSRFVIAFLPRSKHLLISWLQSPSAVILEPEKIRSATASTFLPYICHEMMGTDAMILVFLNVSSQLFHSPLSPLSVSSLAPLCFQLLEWYYLHIRGDWYLSQQSWFHLVILPVWHFSWCTLHRSKQGDSIQPWHTPFPIWTSPLFCVSF